MLWPTTPVDVSTPWWSLEGWGRPWGGWNSSAELGDPRSTPDGRYSPEVPMQKGPSQPKIDRCRSECNLKDLHTATTQRARCREENLLLNGRVLWKLCSTAKTLRSQEAKCSISSSSFSLAITKPAISRGSEYSRDRYKTKQPKRNKRLYCFKKKKGYLRLANEASKQWAMCHVLQAVAAWLWLPAPAEKVPKCHKSKQDRVESWALSNELSGHRFFPIYWHRLPPSLVWHSSQGAWCDQASLVGAGPLVHLSDGQTLCQPLTFANIKPYYQDLSSIKIRHD